MYRVVLLGGKPYALEVETVTDDEENINNFLDTGDVVLFCQDLEDLEVFGIDKDDIEIVV